MSVRKGEASSGIPKREAKRIILSAEKREKPEELRWTAVGRCCLPRLEGNGGLGAGPLV